MGNEARKLSGPRRAGSDGRRIFVRFSAAVAVAAVAAVVGFVALQIAATRGQRLPDFVANASGPAREAYDYAVEHPEVLEGVPCYCGCASSGHDSNLDCFIDERLPEGKIEYDPMGAS